MSKKNGNVKALFSSYTMKILLFIVVIIQIYPIAWLLMSSVKGPTEFNLNPMYALPETLHIQNYIDAWTVGNMGTYFQNSILVTFPALAFIILLGASTAFAIEKMKWKLSSTVMLLFLAGIMVPVQIVILPLFSIYFNVGLLNTHWSLIITYIAFGLPLTIFLFTGFFKSIPNELIEAAVVDGATIYQVFFKIATPMLMNAIVTVALVQFFFVWNDLIFAMTFINDSELRTIQTGLLAFTGQYGSRQWGPTFASISLAVIPILFIYLFLNQKIMKGLTSGAVKG
ncbi:carbohydrate ABC transporter permease [Halalkalibacter sp. APA_J-10(15)]|uniref:carbohydrate ABC transporter permease n=1 Tax=unclassified Halalkalibacter TaxID=2893063 RepID=UPI001FF4DA42|nr:carbohydrate ABC transporter permease [Halalkalibacter sp. APA_J-10(15)]MCK0472850.1 carbohydrate ABC transporter permease [Halalkalibacter sp. APA_J-10(15)]